MLKCVFHLSLRATQGFLDSVVDLMKLELPVCDYSTVSRRQDSHAVLPVMHKRTRHVVVDATGLKVYGAGEWHNLKHQTDWRRAWRKLHLGVDETMKEIAAVEAALLVEASAGPLSYEGKNANLLKRFEFSRSSIPTMPRRCSGSWKNWMN
jgi:hypothetical protein